MFLYQKYFSTKEILKLISDHEVPLMPHQEGVCRLHSINHRAQTEHDPRLRPDHGAGQGTHQRVRLAADAARRQRLDISLNGEGRQFSLTLLLPVPVAKPTGLVVVEVSVFPEVNEQSSRKGL